MASPNGRLQRLADRFANVIPAVDSSARHERWSPGIGPFEEERQLEMILDEATRQGDFPEVIESEVPYPNSGRLCDLLLDDGDRRVAVEAKLLRFRRDNGNIDPNMYKSVFSPFPERSSSTLLTDCQKLYNSGFRLPAGVLGLYYEKNEEEYEELRAELIAEKFRLDVEYWYDLKIEIASIEPFSGLRHPYHQHGAVITWLISEP